MARFVKTKCPNCGRQSVHDMANRNIGPCSGCRDGRGREIRELILRNHPRFTLKEIAGLIGIQFKAAEYHWRRIREQVRRSSESWMGKRLSCETRVLPGNEGSLL